MFKEDDFVYLLLSVVIILAFTTASFVYEVAAVTQDSWFQTAIATVRWQGVIVPVTVTILAIVEFVRVLASRIITRDKEKARQEERAEWVAWFERKDAAKKEGQPFNEPSPDGRQRINT